MLAVRRNFPIIRLRWSVPLRRYGCLLACDQTRLCVCALAACAWQRENVRIVGENEVLLKDAVCLLDIPTHKTGTSFAKPVDPIVGKAIAEWEKVCPQQPPALDKKTEEVVDYLFFYRGYRIAGKYIRQICSASSKRFHLRMRNRQQ
jgi:hypothetical protein